MSASHSKPVLLTNINEIQICPLLIVTYNFNERKKKVLSYTEHDYTELPCKQGPLLSFCLNFFQSTKIFVQNVLVLHMFYIKTLYNVRQKSNDIKD